MLNSGPRRGIFYTVATVLVLATFGADMHLELGYAGGMPYIIPVLLGLWAPDRVYPIVVTAIAVLLTVIGYFVSPLPDEIPVTVYLNRGGAVVAIIVTAVAVSMYRAAAAALQQGLREQRRTEKELRRSKERLLAAQRAALIGCWELTSEGDSWCSDEAYGILGIERGAPLLSALKERVLPADQAAAEAAFAELREQGTLSETLRVVMANEQIRIIHLTGRRVPAGDDGLERFVGTVQDITEQKRLEQRVLLGQQRETIGKLASGVAHEFNNLLMGISGCLSVALKHLGSAHPASYHVGNAAAAARDGAVITRQLMTFASKHDDGPERVAVDDFVTTVAEMLRRLLGENIRLDVETGAADAWVGLAPGRLQQVIMNLALNARDAMPDGGTLSIRTALDSLDSSRDDATSNVTLIVADTGCGMDATTLERAFEPFHTTKALGAGTGLGLTMLRAIISEAKGDIDVESQVGVGTTFRIGLPRVEAPPVSAADEPRQATLDVSGTCVLLVEDERLVRDSVQSYLEDAGCRVHAAESIASARDLCRDDDLPFDLLLTDVILPDGSGPEFAREFAVSRPDAQIVCMSAYPSAMIRQRLSAKTKTLQKPFTKAQLLGAVEEALAERDAPAPSKPASEDPSNDSRGVLIVEDNRRGREAMAALLEDEGFAVFVAGDGAEARGICAAQQDRIGVVVSDFRLPDTTGDVLASELRALVPGCAVVFVSGLSKEEPAIRAALATPDAYFMQKPIDFDRLATTVGELLHPSHGA